MIPLTHGLEAAREIAAGATVSEAGGLMLTETAIGLAYLIVGLGLVRLFEFEGRRSATLETF